jgi:hypothetical protein
LLDLQPPATLATLSLPEPAWNIQQEPLNIPGRGIGRSKLKVEVFLTLNVPG